MSARLLLNRTNERLRRLYLVKIGIVSYGVSLPIRRMKVEEVLNVWKNNPVNHIKNAMGVTVPNTDGMRGIEAAVAAGVVAGNEKKKLECIAAVNDSDRENIREYLAKNIISVELCESELAFDCTVKVEVPDTGKPNNSEFIRVSLSLLEFL